MIDVQKLRGEIVAKGYTMQKIAEEIGITSKTFYAKMKKGEFSSAEMSAMVAILDIKNPTEIFFAELVS